MKFNIILFNRGSGGNFLARVLTLDPATVCLGNLNIESPEQRCEYYCYPEQIIAPNTPAGNGMSVWVDQELNRMYFPLTRGIEQLIKLDQVVIEPMHPDHYENKIKLLGNDDEVNLYYINQQHCDGWVADQVRHKILSVGNIGKNQEQQTSIMHIIIKRNNAHQIELKQIIESEYTFLAEYVKICQQMQLNSYPELALKIYQSWRKTWG